MSFQRGCVVRSTAGRDKGRLLAVTAVTQRGVEVCDGKGAQAPQTQKSRILSTSSRRRCV